MAKINGAAPIIRAAITALQTNMAAHVAAFNAEAANLVDLTVPAEYVFGASAEMIAYPVVEVAVLNARMGPFSVGQAGVGDADFTPTLQVIVWQEGLTGEVPEIYEAGLGYARCVTEILCEHGALGGDADVSGVREDAVAWRVLEPILQNPEAEDRRIRKWKVPLVVSFIVEAVDRWQ